VNRSVGLARLGQALAAGRVRGPPSDQCPFEPPFEPAREVDTDSLPKAKSEGFGQSEGAASMPMRSQTRATAGEGVTGPRRSLKRW